LNPGGERGVDRGAGQDRASAAGQGGFGQRRGPHDVPSADLAITVGPDQQPHG
jgi:hypothetical protein